MGCPWGPHPRSITARLRFGAFGQTLDWFACGGVVGVMAALGAAAAAAEKESTTEAMAPDILREVRGGHQSQSAAAYEWMNE